MTLFTNDPDWYVINRMMTLRVVRDNIKVIVIFQINKFWHVQLTTIVHVSLQYSVERSPPACAGPESFVRGGPTLKFFFLRGERIQTNTTISGPSSTRELMLYAQYNTF